MNGAWPARVSQPTEAHVQIWVAPSEQWFACLVHEQKALLRFVVHTPVDIEGCSVEHTQAGFGKQHDKGDHLLSRCQRHVFQRAAASKIRLNSSLVNGDLRFGAE